MKTQNHVATSIMIGLTFVAFSQLSWGQSEIKIVSPSITENAEGNLPLGGGGSFRTHFRYPAADFLSLSESHQTISGLAWRPDEDNMLFTPVSGPARILLSTIPTDQPLSLTYEDNLTFGDATEVFDGTLTWPTDDMGPGPRDWQFMVEFNRGTFNYDPSQGDLLMEWNPTEDWNEVDTWLIDGQMLENGQVLNNVTAVVNPDPFAEEALFAVPVPALPATQFTFIPLPPGIIDNPGLDNPGLGGRLPPGLRNGLPPQSHHSKPIPEPASIVLLLFGCSITSFLRRGSLASLR